MNRTENLPVHEWNNFDTITGRQSDYAWPLGPYGAPEILNSITTMEESIRNSEGDITSTENPNPKNQKS
jgi:hypothetical protein